MTNKEVEKEIYKKLLEIKEMYYKAYPNGDYLTMAFFKDSVMFNNCYTKEDKDFPLYFWTKTEGEEECEKEL